MNETVQTQKKMQRSEWTKQSRYSETGSEGSERMDILYSCLLPSALRKEGSLWVKL